VQVHAGWEYGRGSEEAEGPNLVSSLPPDRLLLLASGVWLRANQILLSTWLEEQPKYDLLDAILIALSTLCQLDNTAATAVRATRQSHATHVPNALSCAGYKEPHLLCHPTALKASQPTSASGPLDPR
jgi:hypothetical protein